MKLHRELEYHREAQSGHSAGAKVVLSSRDEQLTHRGRPYSPNAEEGPEWPVAFSTPEL